MEETLKDSVTNELKEDKIKDETVEIGKEELQGLISTIHKLQQDFNKFEKGGEVELPTVKVRKARVHFYNGEVITSIGQAWEVDDGRGELLMRLEVYVGDKLYEVDYND